MSTLLIMAGGTGGHVFPALAVADKLRANGINVHWIGTSKGLEAKVVPQADIPLHTIDVAGIRGKSISKKIVGPLGVAKAIYQAIGILRKINPQAVIGMGGYASGPGGIAAKFLGVPLIVHEQNAKPGSTNKILAKVATQVLTGFPDVLPKGLFVGNPVRASFYQQLPPAQRFSAVELKKSFRILILGGSLGARTLNRTVPQALELLLSPGFSNKQWFSKSLQVVHQAGARTIDEAHAAYDEFKKNTANASIPVNCEVVEFIDGVAEELAQAHLVICRSGALTIAELAAVGAASILVPFPYAVDDHQTANARWMVGRGGAELLHEAALSAESLAEAIAQHLINENKTIKMAEAAWLQEPKTATDKVAEICLEYLNV